MGKSSEQTVGYHYRLGFHVVITYQIDAFLELRAADKTGWDGSAQQWNNNGEAVYKRGSNRPIYWNSLPATGAVTSSQEIYVAAPNLFGGEKDQGGILGAFDIMFGEETQLPNAYLQGVFGNQVAAWRGFTTLVCKGARFGAMNPMPQKPAYKVRKIKEGWDEPGCWYPEKAPIPFAAGSGESGLGELRNVGMRVTIDAPINKPSECTLEMAVSEGYGYTASDEYYWFWRANESGIGYIKFNNESTAVAVRAMIDRGLKLHQTALLKFTEGSLEIVVITPSETSPPAPEGDEWFQDTNNPISTSLGSVYLWRHDMAIKNVGPASLFAMNPAHALYYVRTSSERGREPRANINDASLRAAADRLYAEGFGLSWKYDPSRDTPDSFEERICRIIGGSFERSLTDGQWYLDLARGDYDIDSLPIIGDDDILEFKELPTTLDRAVNSVAVRYFDVERKESVITPAVRALGLIRRFGEIHETLDFPEIPTGSLALRVADREARAYVTPTRAFELVTTPRLKALRRNQYARLQSPRRGIADMVVIIGSKEHGTLKSGAIRWKVSQDVYALPDTSYIEIEEGVDTSPPTTPVPIEHAAAFEAPYIDLVAALPSSELAALEPDAGFLVAVAADPGAGLSYAMAVQPSGGDYMLGGNGEWCPTTTTAGAHLAEIGPTVVPLASVTGLPEIGLGSAVLWGDEWCRLDAIDYDTAEATLARGCADTVPHPHAAGSRLWFYVEAAYATTEFTDGETVNIKLLPETGTAQLPLDSATAMPLEFNARQARPYPPAGLLINGEQSPETVVGEITLTWVHRDRVLQADQLVGQDAAGVGPEAGTTYNVRWYLNEVLAHSDTGITGTTASYTPAGGGLLRIEVESERDGLASWQMHVREFVIGTTLTTETGELITTEDGQPIFME